MPAKWTRQARYATNGSNGSLVGVGKHVARSVGNRILIKLFPVLMFYNCFQNTLSIILLVKSDYLNNYDFSRGAHINILGTDYIIEFIQKFLSLQT